LLLHLLEGFVLSISITCCFVMLPGPHDQDEVDSFHLCALASHLAVQYLPFPSQVVEYD
jgi:hypothetical protein